MYEYCIGSPVIIKEKYIPVSNRGLTFRFFGMDLVSGDIHILVNNIVRTIIPSEWIKLVLCENGILASWKRWGKAIEFDMYRYCDNEYVFHHCARHSIVADDDFKDRYAYVNNKTFFEEKKDIISLKEAEKVHITNDVENTKYSFSYDSSEVILRKVIPDVKKVIYNGPATIVFWADNTKTIVKCNENDEFDLRTGFLEAVGKKLFGSSHAIDKIIENSEVQIPFYGTSIYQSTSIASQMIGEMRKFNEEIQKIKGGKTLKSAWNEYIKKENENDD